MFLFGIVARSFVSKVEHRTLWLLPRLLDLDLALDLDSALLGAVFDLSVGCRWFGGATLASELGLWPYTTELLRHVLLQCLGKAGEAGWN